jgi:pimeloyl-ACP methyl ester carboxylesterase
MGLHGEREHWFSFRDSCIVVIEKGGAGSPFFSRKKYSLFFLHGRFGHTEMWAPLIESFSAHYRCFVLDLPGFGKSFMARDRAFSLLDHSALVLELIQKLSSPDEKIILIGHDIGGGIAQLCALNRPENIAALILMNSVGITSQLSKVSTCFHGYFARKKLQQLISQARSIVPQYKRDLSHPWESRLSRQLISKAMLALEESWPWHYERQTWKNAIQNFPLPVLLLWGKNDSLNLPQEGMELAHRFPEAYFFIHEEAGHWPCLEQTDWVLLKMKEFIFKLGYETQIAMQR